MTSYIDFFEALFMKELSRDYTKRYLIKQVCLIWHEGSELTTKCNQLKMCASDTKNFLSIIKFLNTLFFI